MTTLSLPTFPSGNVFMRTWQDWVRPRATDQEIAFRESTIRKIVAIVIVLTGLSLLSELFFRNKITLISYTTLEFIELALSTAAAVIISRKQVGLAGAILVASVSLVGASALVLAGGPARSTAIFMLSIMVAAIVLPVQWTLPVALINVIVGAIVAYGSPLVGIDFVADPGATTITNLILFVAEALFLIQLRAEFDSRLQNMRLAISQAEKAQKEAETANKAKSQFVANMSHELRTPMNAVLGYTEIMLGGMAGALTEKQAELQNYIYGNGKRLLALINDVLDLSRIESGVLNVKPEPFSPAKLVNDLADNMRSLAQKNNIGFNVRIEADVPEVVLCDAGKVQQILTNLIGNAIKFTQAGSVDVTVLKASDTRWQVVVKDSGIGMPADAPSYIFDAFRQVDNSDTRQFQGTGLGLAITKRLIDAMDGTIKVESTLNVGSTFTITLPRVFETK